MDRVKQRTEAMAKANHYRTAVSVRRREIANMPPAEGYETLAELIGECDDPALLSGRLSHWLTAPKFSGHTKANQAIACLNLKKADRRVRDLTPRQRQELAEIVRYRLNVREWRRNQLLEQVA